MHWYDDNNLDDMVVLKIDNAGNAIWTYRYDLQGNDDEVSESIAILGGALVTFGVSGPDGADKGGFISRIGPDGMLQAVRQYFVPNADITHFRSGRFTADGGILINGYIRDNTGDRDHIIAKVDASLNLDWIQLDNTNYQSDAGYTVQDNNGDIYLFRRILNGGTVLTRVMKFDDDANFVWSKNIANSTTAATNGIVTGITYFSIFDPFFGIYKECIILADESVNAGFGGTDAFFGVFDTDFTSCITADATFNYADKTASTVSTVMDTMSINYIWNTTDVISSISYDMQEACGPAVELCGNSLDDDCDGLTDCDDPDLMDSCCCRTDTPVVDLGPDTTLCDLSSYTLNAGGGFVSYTWQDGSTDSIFTATQSGTYWVEVCDECFCASDTVILLFAESDFIVLDTPLCQGQSFVFNGTMIQAGDTTAFMYQNQFGCDSVIEIRTVPLDTYATVENIEICTGDSVLIFGQYEANPGMYFMEFTAANGCDSSHAVNLSVFPLFQVTYAVTASCEGQDNGAIVIDDPVGGSPPYTYDWDVAGASGQMATDLPPGSYSATVTDANGCSQVFFFSVDVLLAPDWSVSTAAATCVGATDGQIIVSPAGLMYSLDGTNFQSDTVFADLESGDYDVYIMDGNCVYTMSAIVDAPIIWTIDLPTDITVNLGTSVELPATTDAPAGYSVFWSPDTALSCNDCLNPIVTPTENTIYSVTVTDANGCTNTAEISVIVIEVCSGDQLGIPNAFTPNRDGVNDEFGIVNATGAEDIVLFQVYSRWGELVFEAFERTAMWDGTFSGKDVPSGVYVYFAEYICPDGTRGQVSGDVTLIR